MRDPIDRRRDLADRTAALLARVGGASVIVVLAALFLFLLREALPLGTEARLEPLPGPSALAEVAPDAVPTRAVPTRRHGVKVELGPGAARVRTDAGTILGEFALTAPLSAGWSHSGGSLILGSATAISRIVLHREDSGAWALAGPIPYASIDGPVEALAVSPATPHFAVASGRSLTLFRLHGHEPAARRQLTVPVDSLRWSPNGRILEARSASGRERFAVQDPFPGATLGALWTPVHRDYAAAPAFQWQPTGLEPAYSLLPLAWGTLKAALLGMLFGAPIAILAAVHTAFFARPRTRRLVKPTLELMEGLPTVVLGLVAAMILAPALEQHLLALLVTLAALPLLAAASGLLAAALRRRGQSFQERWPWLLMPLLVLTVLAVFLLGQRLDEAFPGGFVPWLELELGWDYRARNSLLVGLVVGLAIFPSIFTLAEDAVFAVPDRLARGAFALGATRWEAFRGVVLPMASPGILAALIIGLARGIGETMIVLMVSGNTPLLDLSALTGLRSLAANLAIELPETGPGSEHYRVLFLSALLLFLGTFALNALADWIRNRLRRRYALS